MSETEKKEDKVAIVIFRVGETVETDGGSFEILDIVEGPKGKQLVQFKGWTMGVPQQEDDLKMAGFFTAIKESLDKFPKEKLEEVAAEAKKMLREGAVTFSGFMEKAAAGIMKGAEILKDKGKDPGEDK